MIDTIRHAAENLFSQPNAEDGSNAAKLQSVRERQMLRKREQKLAEKQERLEKRVGPAAPKSGRLFSTPISS